jgi:hypothetical protein
MGFHLLIWKKMGQVYTPELLGGSASFSILGGKYTWYQWRLLDPITPKIILAKKW